MRVPISWLRDYVDVPADVTHEAVHAALVKVGLEEEDVHTFDVSGPVVVGQVLSFEEEPQSNGKTIRWVQVDVAPSTGSGQARDIRGIVCGASNFLVGDKVVVSLPGAVLPGPFPISARKTYGHVSDGMMASARELGLGDEHSGIIRLSEMGLDPEVGTDAITLLGLDDFAVEVNVTPDRGYAFSLRGIAREYAHATGAAFTDPGLRADPNPLELSGFPLSITDDAPLRDRAGSAAFAVRTVRGVDPTRPTPPWMVARLTLAGIRSISLAVDITNYVMLELGQPTHAYDLDRLSGGIVVRRATAGETITTLDEKVRTLDAQDLLITDDSGPIGIAGVMGGASTEIHDGTTNVLVEAANFDPVTIARTSRRHKLVSEASKRFERGVDPVLGPVAAARVVELLVELGGGVADPLGAVIAYDGAPADISLPETFIEKLIGVAFSADEITDTLGEIGATVVASDRGWNVTPPTWRPDLVDAPSLAEEVARIVGYDRIPSVLPVAPPGRGLTRSQRLRRSAANALAASGLTEVYSYPFISKASNDQFGSAVAGEVTAMKLANPLDSEAAWMRTSLIPGLLTNARRNLSRGLTDLALYEIGAVYLPQAGVVYGTADIPAGGIRPEPEVLGGLRENLPPQPWHVGALFVGDAVRRQPGQPAVVHGVADAVAAARRLAATLSVELTVVTGSHHALHPGRTAELRVGDTVVGYAGELLPALADELDLPRVVAVFEVDFDALIQASPEQVSAQPILSMPAATQDVTLVVTESVRAGELLATLVEGGGDLLEHVTLVDDYRGTGIPDGSKALTYALRFRATDRTLTAAEATEAKEAAVALAFERFGAAQRA